MRVLLLQLDGKLPNLALMRIAHHHMEQGHYVELRRCGNRAALEPRFEDRLWAQSNAEWKHGDTTGWDKVYGSLIFQSTLPVAERAMEVYPHIDLGGTGWSLDRTLADVRIEPDGMYKLGYSLYPKFSASIGFTQRGCRLSCDFCVVPKKEGKPRHNQMVSELWRGTGSRAPVVPAIGWEAYGDDRPGTPPRHLLLLDNDFFGGPKWELVISDIINGRFKVCFNQGINARALNKETAAAIASVDYRDDSFKAKRIYTAWDNIGHEKPLMRGLEALVAAGVKPDHIMVYMLIGFGDSQQDREHRRRQLRAFGARPYPMPYVRTPELVGFQRWVIGAYDKPSAKNPNGISWEKWAAAKYEPRKLGAQRVSLPLFTEDE